MTRGEMVWNVTAVVGNSIALCQVMVGGLKETVIEIMFSLRPVDPTLVLDCEDEGEYADKRKGLDYAFEGRS